MGRATRWLKELLFGPKIPQQDTREISGHQPPQAADLCLNPSITSAQAAWLRSFYSEPDSEQGMRARAVAPPPGGPGPPARGAAADAAVAAAQAAFEVVRLTSRGGGSGTASMGGSRKNLAAVNIQRVFRGFLARKALRALKGLVKIQALVRGFLVRKQAAATLHGMEALVRTQANLRARKINLHISSNGEKFPPEFQARKSSSATTPPEAATNRLDQIPKIVEVDTWCRPKSRSKRIIINRWITESIEDHHHHHPHECTISSAQSTPRYPNSCRGNSSNTWRVDNSYLGCSPSNKPKPRSQSAPKQRRGSLRQVMGAKISLSGEMEISRRKMAQEALDFKNAVMGKLRMN